MYVYVYYLQFWRAYNSFYSSLNMILFNKTMQHIYIHLRLISQLLTIQWFPNFIHWITIVVKVVH